MTQIELLSVFFTLVLGVGIVLNYNLIYATINRQNEWRVTANFNQGFPKIHNILGWATYALGTLWYVFWSARFEEGDFWFTVVIVDAYLLSRIGAWFVLSRRIRLQKQRAEMAKVGPDGTLSPESLSNTSNTH